MNRVQAWLTAFLAAHGLLQRGRGDTVGALQAASRISRRARRKSSASTSRTSGSSGSHRARLSGSELAT